MGDRILIRVATTLSGNFRSNDYICRLGGDEFVVLMIHTDETQKKLIASKINQINMELAAKDDENIASTSVSVGVAHGSHATDTGELFKQADKALYETKRRGKNGYSFYTS